MTATIITTVFVGYLIIEVICLKIDNKKQMRLLQECDKRIIELSFGKNDNN